MDICMKSRHKAVTRRLFPKELKNLTYTGDLRSGQHCGKQLVQKPEENH